MYKSSKIANAIHLAILFGMGSVSAIVSPVFASDDNIENIERILVTGSNIKRADIETASPLLIIDSATISASGATSIDKVLQRLTIAGGIMGNAGLNSETGGNTDINLRGLGLERTLVLLNGRRVIASGTGAAATVDLNTIPLTMIDRIEVLKDGASAIYGADAVAGVVNIILKRDFEGFEINLQTGMSGQGDAEESSIDLIMGHVFDKGNVVFGLQYTDRGSAEQSDRSNTSCPKGEFGDIDNITLECTGSVDSEGGHIWGEFADVSGRGGTYHDFVYGGSDSDEFNYAQYSYLSTPMQRLNLTALTTYELKKDITFFAEATYTKRWSKQKLAPEPILNTELWEYQPISAGGFMTDDLLPFIQPGELVDYGRRMLSTGTRDFSQTVDTVRVVLGLEGELSNDWHWNVTYNKGRNDSIETTDNLHNIVLINNAVQFGTFDPFDQNSWQQSNIAPYVYTELNTGGSEMDIFSATLSGDLIELPAGFLRFATGYEYRSESAFYTPDSLTSQGFSAEYPSAPTSGSYNVDELYAELSVPLVKDSAIAKALDLSLAMRYFDYNSFGDDTTWKVGITWKVNDQIMLRGGKSTAFRAPTVNELYSGDFSKFDEIFHPASPYNQAEAIVGGNENLTPEEADIITFGLVFEPDFIKGLSMTLDYYDIDIRHAIDDVDTNYLAQQCLSDFGDLINTDTALCQTADLFIDGTGFISFYNRIQNIGGQQSSGYDINIAYNFEALNLNWQASIDAAVLTRFEKSDQEGNKTDFKGVITGGDGAYAEHKINANVTVAADNWHGSYNIRYIDGMDSAVCIDAPNECYAPSVDRVIYHDLSGAYGLTETVTLSGGVNNVFDKKAPYYSGYKDSNTDPYTYDVVGRFFFVKASMKF